jgi:hypothetical protein
MHAGFGGLARRATLLASKQQRPTRPLLVDAGNFLFGPDSIGSDGKVMIAAYDALGYDAVNLSFRDFRSGRDHTLELLTAGGHGVVSANLLNAASHQLLVKPYVVVRSGSVRVAIIGISQPAAGMMSLAHLKRQLAGIEIRPATEALAEWLPKAKAESDQVIVLYYGSDAGLHDVREKFGRELSAILVGGVTQEPSNAGGTALIARAEEHGRSLTSVRLEGEPGPSGSRLEVIPISPALAPDPAMVKLIAQFEHPTSETLMLGPAQPTTSVATAAPTTAAVAVSTPLPSEPRPAPPVPQTATTIAASNPSILPADPPLHRVRATTNAVARGLEGVGLTADQVNAAIEHGRDFLWAHLQAELAKEHRRFGQSENGVNLLEGLALVHAGAQLKYPAFDAMIRDYLDRLDPVHDSLGTYQTGILCMLIGDYADPKYLPKMRLLARSLVEQQLAEGSWHYGRAVPDSAFGDLTSGPPLSVEGGIPLDDPNAALGQPISRALPFEKHDPGDNSTSQFAMLGLRAAARVRVRSGAEIWQRSLRAFETRRCKDGGWGYEARAISSYGSMSCSGICSIAIARYELGEKEPTIDPAIETGLAWLDSHFSVTTNPEHGGYLYYYLYSLERVGRILDTEFIGSHEWYPLGAQFLVGAQRPDGSWLEPYDSDPRPPTSFALLFLTRATQSLKVEIKRGGRGQVTTSVATPPPARLYVILDASGSMLDDMDGRQKFDIARESVATMFAGLPDSAEVALRVYGHRKRSLEPGSDEDTALEFPMAKIDRAKLKSLLQRLRPRGKTPLALSLQQAKQDLSSLSGQPVTIVLLTDGGEDTRPRRDPVKAAAEFAQGPGVTFHIIGFDINQDDWGEQLRAMAAAGHGHYWPAARAKALERQIRSAVFGIPDDFALYDSSAREVTRGEFGQSKTLPEGKYLFKTTYGGRDFQSELWVNTAASTGVMFDASHVPTAPSGPTPAPAPAVAQRFCTKCGQPLPPGAKFCPHCGEPVRGG